MCRSATRPNATDETLSSNDFQWDAQADEYRCPQGNPLRRQWRPFKNLRTHITKADTIIYRSSQADCANCPMKERCCPNTPMRKIARSVHESARDVARDIAKTNAYKRSRKERKKVEMLFAHLKRILKLDRLRLRGPEWRSRRVSAGGNCAEPTTNGETVVSGNTRNSEHRDLNWRRISGANTKRRTPVFGSFFRPDLAAIQGILKRRVFQRHWPQPAVAHRLPKRTVSGDRQAFFTQTMQ